MNKIKTRKVQQIDIYSELLAHREDNIKETASWPMWEIEDFLKRTKTAKQSFLSKDPMHDLRIIEEHIYQTEQALKIKSEQEAES